jgi:hypothetical protein
MKIKLLLVVFFISNCLSTPNIRKISNQPQFRSESHYFSEVITSSNVNGKPESHVRKMELEEFRNKDNGQPEKVRKFGQIIKKDNDKKAQVIRQASSNVEEEGLILGNGKEKKTLEKNEEKQLLPEADQLFKTKGFKDMFNLDMVITR